VAAMSDQYKNLPPHVQALLDGNLKSVGQSPVRLSSEQIAKLSPAQRLDYSRQWDQSTMPPWRDPRGQ
jgi:hypothetical protein